jgi:hypothetical protein
VDHSIVAERRIDSFDLGTMLRTVMNRDRPSRDNVAAFAQGRREYKVPARAASKRRSILFVSRCPPSFEGANPLMMQIGFVWSRREAAYE